MKIPGKHVSVLLARAFLAYAASVGIDGDALMKSAGIGPDDLKDGGGRIGAGQIFSAAAALADASGGALSGLRLADGVSRLYGGNNILMTIMCCCPTLEDALKKLARYHGIASNGLKLELKTDGAEGALVLTPDTGFPLLLVNVFLEAAVAACTGMIKNLTAGPGCMAQVCLTSPEPEDPEAYRCYFSCPVVFGCEKNEIVFQRGALNAPLALSDPALLSVLEGYARSKLAEAADGSMSEKLRNYMDSMISQGKAFQIGEAAEALGVSIRTLQKQLKNESVTYRTLLEETKRDIAVKSLEDPGISLMDTAFLLGFSEQSAFNRAFRKWTGVSPMKYRQGRQL